MHAISLFVCWWFANGTLLHAFCIFSFWTKSKPLNWNRRREKNMKGASELYWTKWSMLSGLTVYEQEKGREKGVRESPLYLFFFLSPSFFSTVKCICLQPLCSAHKAVWRLKTCFLYVRFSRCDMQGNCYFLPPTVVYGKQVSKTPSVSKVNLIKVAKWKVHALIFPSLGCVWEFEICSCDSGSQFFSFFFSFSLYFEVRTCKMYATLDTKKADGFLSWIGLLLNYIGTLSCEVYSLITILLKNTGVILGSYKMEDGVKNTFVS